ncbi:MAG: hypothetical protein QOI59_2534 [Gammaproteobacteria bacterium]|nr:hypothetical protein [Gammaproteobacteria bacterium]
MMAAGLQSYIRSCAHDGLFGRANGSNFGMRFASTLVPPFGDDAIVLGNNASNPRIRMRCFQTPFGER